MDRAVVALEGKASRAEVQQSFAEMDSSVTTGVASDPAEKKDEAAKKPAASPDFVLDCP